MKRATPSPSFSSVAVDMLEQVGVGLEHDGQVDRGTIDAYRSLAGGAAGGEGLPSLLDVLDQEALLPVPRSMSEGIAILATSCKVALAGSMSRRSKRSE